MSVYSVTGSQLTSVHGVNGTTLSTAYDINGNAVFGGQSYPIENVQSYFRSETLSVADAVNGLSDDWQTFVFITDPHGRGNKQHSQAIALYLLHNTNCKMLVLGGDYSVSNWDKSQYDTYMSPFLNSGLVKNIYVLFGNHETYGGGTAEAKVSIYNDFLKDKTNINGQPSENYYYFDNTTQKTRYMFINTSDGGETTVSSAQLSWISNNVVLPASDWSLVVFGHVNLAQMAGVTYMNESNGSAVISAINNCNGTIIGYICGHQHIDYCEKIGDFQHTTIICDKFENSNYYAGISVTDREAGTTSEQAVSVISINTTTKDVVIRRIGAGRSRTLSYNYS